MKVMKFGGTSVGDASRMKMVANIVSAGQPVLVVLSAIAGTTDALANLVDSLKAGDEVAVIRIIEKLQLHYYRYIDELFVTPDVSSSNHQAKEIVEIQFRQITETISQKYVPAIEFHILAKGEVISTALFHLYLKQTRQQVTLLSAFDFLRLNQQLVPDEDYLAERLNAIIREHQGTEIFITQGFVCRNAFGEVANLKRGGSDYSASLFAAAIQAEEVQIWTDIDGMHNNDPRYVKGTRAIRELSFNEAAELAYFGAKILHPASIKPARRKNIPVKLLNTLQADAQGTLISSKTTLARIKAIAAKSGITAIKIRSSEMLQAPGFLRRIFEVFELYRTSIDMITTSEVAVSVTIDDITFLTPIIETLKEFGHVEVDKKLSIICVVGDFVVDNKGIASQVIQAIKDIPIRMISYGGSAHNISLLISEDKKIRALNSLQKGLFND